MVGPSSKKDGVQAGASDGVAVGEAKGVADGGEAEVEGRTMDAVTASRAAEYSAAVLPSPEVVRRA